MPDHAPTLENPLLAESGYPAFDAIEPNHVIPAVRKLLSDAESGLTALEAHTRQTWEDLVERLDELGRPFERTWAPVQHLFGVKNSPELREAYEEALPEIVRFGLRVKQSEPIDQGLRTLRESSQWNELDEAQQRIIDAKLLEAELAGIALTGKSRERFNEIAEELSELSTRFSNNVLDATKAWSLTLTDPSRRGGTPAQPAPVGRSRLQSGRSRPINRPQRPRVDPGGSRSRPRVSSPS